MKSIRVRFAPSPTGLLHLGNARLALLNWLFVRQHKGFFLLRIDDTDTVRSSEVFVEAIRCDLSWLGLMWDDVVYQSVRRERYWEICDVLRDRGMLYPCYETPEELVQKRESLLQQKKPPVYDRTGLRLDEGERKRLEAQGRRPHWRFMLTAGKVSWRDEVHGHVNIKTSTLSDPIVLSEEQRPLYTLSSIIDDSDYGITHVIRGADHLTNTAIQIRLLQALDKPIPSFAHVPLLTDATGQGLSKRLASMSLQYFRDEVGVEPMTLNSFLAKLGTSESIEPYTTLQPLVETFDFKKIGRTSLKCHEKDICLLNKRILDLLPFESISERLFVQEEQSLASQQIFWEIIRPNIQTLKEVEDWSVILRRQFVPRIIDEELTQTAAQLLPAEPWSDNTWDTWISTLKQSTEKRGKALFYPLRLALTGRDKGPELQKIFNLLGYTRVSERLQGVKVKTLSPRSVSDTEDGKY